MGINVSFRKVAGRIAIIVIVGFLSGCASIPVDDRARVRAEIDQRADDAITKRSHEDPQFDASLQSADGYFVGRLSSTKVPLLGGATGLGVLIDNADQTRTYLNIDRFDLGVGIGAGRFRVMIVFKDRQILEQFKRGTWKSTIGAASSAGVKGNASVSSRDGIDVYFFSESGAALTTTARLVRLSVNTDLTDTGISAFSIPNTDFRTADEQDETAPRIWGRKLPFLAQKVIDEGYDLPLPYGVGITVANVRQDMLLDNLEVGINGSDKEPFEFVAFENSKADSDTAQLKLDAWLFPFMNVFAMFGSVDGSAPLDVILDGNGMLEQLEINCSGFPPSPLCGLLEDRTITLPIEANYSGNTYGIGTILTGGWNDWFVALPFSFTYADMKTTKTDGISITVTPRGGRVIDMGRWGNLAIFGGGNYLKTELTITGQVSTPDELLVIDYTIDQQNTDRWNLVLGANWDFNRHLSWSAEYNGFVGSREAFISSFTYRW